jgi:hypothetical protein
MRRETRIQKTSLISPTSNTSATLRDVSVSAASDEPSQLVLGLVNIICEFYSGP